MVNDIFGVQIDAYLPWRTSITDAIIELAYDCYKWAVHTNVYVHTNNVAVHLPPVAPFTNMF